jgi:signal transduction histidine kinase
VAWRRSRPDVSLVVVMAALALQSALTGGAEAGGGFLLVLIAVYSAAAYGDWPWLTLAATAAALAVHDVRDPYIHGASDAIFAPAFAAVGFALGRALHGRGLRARVLADHARRLERERDQQTRLAVAEERARIARELHDVVAHSVSVMVIQALAGKSILDNDTDGARQVFATIESTGQQAMAEMRRLVGLLREHEHHQREPQPGLAQLPELIEEVARAGLTATLDTEGPPLDLAPGIDLAAYRIIQEALTNTLKHAGPCRVQVTIRYRQRMLELEILDDGHAMTNGARRRHEGRHGLIGMRERVELYSGDLHAAARPNGGFAVRARLPVDAHPSP